MDQKTAILNVRLAPAFREMISQAAERDGLTISEYLREVVSAYEDVETRAGFEEFASLVVGYCQDAGVADVRAWEIAETLKRKWGPFGAARYIALDREKQAEIIEPEILTQLSMNERLRAEVKKQKKPTQRR